MKRPVPATVLPCVIILLALMTAGCIRINNGEANKGPVSIGNVTLATSVSADGQPLSVSSNFLASTPSIYISAQVTNAPSNTQVGARWYYVKDNNGNVLNKLLFEDSTTVKGTQYFSFNHAPASGLWGPGQYSISILLNNADTTTASFTVQQVQQANIPAPTIIFFKALPEAISIGQAVTLSWNTTGATTVSLSGIGNVPSVGNKIVVPINSREYTLTASNSAGTTLQKVSIDVTSFISDKPDLTITDFWVEGSKAYYKIKNIGQTKTTPSDYTNPNAKQSLTYLYIEGNYRDSSRVDVLAPDEERTMSFPNYVWTYGTGRTYKLPIRICADGQNQIGEYDKNNNCLVLDW